MGLLLHCTWWQALHGGFLVLLLSASCRASSSTTGPLTAQQTGFLQHLVKQKCAKMKQGPNFPPPPQRELH